MGAQEGSSVMAGWSCTGCACVCVRARVCVRVCVMGSSEQNVTAKVERKGAEPSCHSAHQAITGASKSHLAGCREEG